MTGATHDAGKILNAAGWTDIRIAEAFRVSTATIRKWREGNGIPSTAKRCDLLERRALYNAGWGDKAIARAQNVDQSTVTKWRMNEGLPAHYPCRRIDPEKRAKIKRAFKKGASRRQIAERFGINLETAKTIRREIIRECGQHPGLRRTGVRTNPGRVGCKPPKHVSPHLFERASACIARRHLSPDIAADVVSEMCLAVLSGELPESELEAKASRYASRVLGDCANKFGPRSLDDDSLLSAERIEDASAERAMDQALQRAFGQASRLSTSAR